MKYHRNFRVVTQILSLQDDGIRSLFRLIYMINSNTAHKRKDRLYHIVQDDFLTRVTTTMETGLDAIFRFSETNTFL